MRPSSPSFTQGINLDDIKWDHSFVRELPRDSREGTPVREDANAAPRVKPETIASSTKQDMSDRATNKIQNTVTTAAEVEQNLMVGINEENVTVKGITIFSSSKEALNHEKFAEEICLEENGDNEDVLEAYVQKVKKQQPRRRAAKKDIEALPLEEFVREDALENFVPLTDTYNESLVLSGPVAMKSSIECAHSQGNNDKPFAEEQVKKSLSIFSPKVQRKSKILSEDRKNRCSETPGYIAAQVTAEDPPHEDDTEGKSTSKSGGRKRKDVVVKKDSSKIQLDKSLQNDIQESPTSNISKTKRKKEHGVASESAEEVGKERNKVNESANEDKEKKKLKKYVPRPRKVERRAVKINPADPDLDLKKMSMRDIIRLAESKDRMMRNDDAKKSNGTATNVAVQEEDVQRTSFAPQVQIIDGRIVINEESLTISAHPKDDIRTYKRVEETHSKLNYHSYTKKTTRANWQKEETERFYEALREFGTNFAIIQHLFPGRTRKQILLKFKMEEKKFPSRVSDALLIKPIECSQYLKVMNLMNLQPIEAPEAEISQQDSWFSDVGFNGEDVSKTQSTAYTEVVSELNKPSPVHNENVKDEKENIVTNQPDCLETTKIGDTEKLELKPEDKSPKCNESPVRDPVVPRKRSLFSYQMK